MTIPNSFELANDSEFRLLANFTTPPRAGRITAIESSGQVRVATDDPDGGDVLAWPLNGFGYAVDDVVYIAFAANSPDTALVIGARSPLPTLDAAVLPEAYVPVDGSDPLTGDWDIGEDRRILAEGIRARDNEGVRLEDDAGATGLVVADGGDAAAPEGLTVGSATPGHGQKRLRLASTDPSGAGVMEFHNGTDAMFWFLEPTGSGGKGHIRTDSARAIILQDRSTSTGGVGIGTNAPQGKLHVHDGTGGLLFVTKTGIAGVAQTIIPNGTGDVTGGLTGFFIASDGAGAVGNMLSMLPGDTLDVVMGAYTMRLALSAAGALTAVRQSGSGSASLVLLAVWM